MVRFGELSRSEQDILDEIVASTASLEVRRRAPGRSATPFPTSEDLERALIEHLARRGFEHHVTLPHPREALRFEYDFFHPVEGIAMEIMVREQTLLNRLLSNPKLCCCCPDGEGSFSMTLCFAKQHGPDLPRLELTGEAVWRKAVNGSQHQQELLTGCLQGKP